MVDDIGRAVHEKYTEVMEGYQKAVNHITEKAAEVTKNKEKQQVKTGLKLETIEFGREVSEPSVDDKERE